MSLSLAQIRLRAEHFKADKKWYRSLAQRAAVCIIVAERPELGTSLLMIQRAVHNGDPWSGQMAFPGGKHEIDDAHITQTALRECAEELGIAAQVLNRFGRLSDILARPYRLQQKPMVVSPLLFECTQDIALAPNHEVADVLWVPLSLFTDPANRQQMTWQRGGVELNLPCYFYQGKRIWGLSLMMIDELTNRLL